MLLMNYAVPPHRFTCEAQRECKYVCPFCEKVVEAESAVVAEGVYSPAFNDKKSEAHTLVFCSLLCVMLSMSGGSRA